MKHEELMRAQEVADTLGIHLLTVYVRGKAGTIPGRVVLPGSRTVRFRRSAINQLIAGKAEAAQTDRR
jgi:excisionase family DNA binding protein